MLFEREQKKIEMEKEMQNAKVRVRHVKSKLKTSDNSSPYIEG